MGLTITTVANGDVMSSSIQRGNVTAVRDWLRGGVLTSDIVGGQLKSRHFRKMDHYAGSNPRSIGITGSVWAQYVPPTLIRRQYALADAQGIAKWEDVADVIVRGYAPIDGRLSVVARVWMWPVKADSATVQVDPESFDEFDIRIAVGASGVDHTNRRLQDSGHDDNATGVGQYPYGARNFVMLQNQAVSAGWFDVAVQTRALSQAPAPTADYGIGIIGTCSLHVEYFAK